MSVLSKWREIACRRLLTGNVSFVIKQGISLARPVGNITNVGSLKIKLKVGT